MSCMTIPEAVADIRNNIAILRMARPPALSTENVLLQLFKFANNVEQAYERLSAAHRRELEEREREAEEHATEHAEAVAHDNCRDCILRHPYKDFGGAGVATLHKYEVRETVAGRCNLVATFTDPNRAEEYAARIAREDGNGND